MTDYQIGISRLKACLPKEKLEEVDTLADRLNDNLHRESLFGGTPLTRSERYEITHALNRLAHAHCGISFYELCENQPLSRSEGNKEAQGLSIGTVQPPSPRISYKLLTKIMPTAYCYNRRADDFPFVTVTIDNTAPESIDTTVLVSVYIEDFSDTPKKTVTVPAQHQESVSFLPKIKRTILATLNERSPATLHIIAEQNTSTKAEFYHKIEDILLHARNTALLAVAQQDSSVRDLTDYLAAWVTPRNLQIRKLVRKAKKYYNGRDFVGYPGTTSSLAEEAKIVNEQAQAIFEVIKKEAHLAYIPLSSMPDDTIDGQITQSVRLPSEALAEGGSANCLDGAVLFASLLESIDIQPLLVLVPGHAIVGWRISRDVDQYEFLDTTLIEDNDFQNARETAQTIYEQALLKRDHKRDLFDPNGFARIIDLATCRKKGIIPLE